MLLFFITRSHISCWCTTQMFATSIPLWNTKNHYTVFTNDFSFFDTKNSLNLTLISFIWTSPPLLLMYSINFSAWDLSSLDASEKNLENPGRDTSARAKYCDWNLKWKVLNARRTATGMEKLRSNYCQDFIVLLLFQPIVIENI